MCFYKNTDSKLERMKPNEEVPFGEKRLVSIDGKLIVVQVTDLEVADVLSLSHVSACTGCIFYTYICERDGRRFDKCIICDRDRVGFDENYNRDFIKPCCYDRSDKRSIIYKEVIF